jgi:hypothetical protein
VVCCCPSRRRLPRRRSSPCNNAGAAFRLPQRGPHHRVSVLSHQRRVVGVRVPGQGPQSGCRLHLVLPGQRGQRCACQMAPCLGRTDQRVHGQHGEERFTGTAPLRRTEVPGLEPQAAALLQLHPLRASADRNHRRARMEDGAPGPQSDPHRDSLHLARPSRTPRTRYLLPDVEPVYRSDPGQIDALRVCVGLGYAAGPRCMVEFRVFAQNTRPGGAGLAYTDSISRLHIKFSSRAGIRRLLDGGTDVQAEWRRGPDEGDHRRTAHSRDRAPRGHA